jgi:hypothetical protein
LCPRVSVCACACRSCSGTQKKHPCQCKASKFTLSLQALLFRLNDLSIISDAYNRQLCIDINRLGWRKEEPEATS